MSSVIRTIKPNDAFNPVINKKILKAVSVIESRRALYRSNYLWTVRVKVNNIFTKGDNKLLLDIKNRGGKYTNSQTLRQHFLDSFDKANACFYHMTKLIEEENWLIKNGQKVAYESNKINPDPGIFCTPLETINYELEAFFSQAYSCLEIFSKGIAFMFKNQAGFHTIEKVLTNANDLKAKKILKVFTDKKYLDLINEFKKSENRITKQNRRDYLSHSGMLPMCQVNVPLNSNTNFSVSMLPSHVNQYDEAIKTKDYIDSLFYLLCDFLIEILEIIFDIKIKSGRKTSNLMSST